MTAVARVMGKISSIASVVAALAGNPVLSAAFAANAAIMGAIAGSPQKPPVKGSATQITIGVDQATPYAMGRTAALLCQEHDVGYGGTVGGVPNPYRTIVYVASIGPVGSIEALQCDFTTVAFAGGNATGYYHDFLHASTQLGACPEGAALAGPYGAIPAWGAAYKLSGKAAVMFTAKFDGKGKVYASGLPQFGLIFGTAALVYDQRQDDTHPGGAGACRALNEATYVGGDAAHNPSCHAVTYALGRWQNGFRVMGCGIAPARIDWPAWTEFANVCDANGWKIGGSVTEPGSRWDNLKRICAAGGGVPAWTGGLLTVTFQRPRVALDTISAADLADGELRIPAMRTWKERINGIVPKYPSEANRWELVDSDLVTSPTYVTEDRGNEKNQGVTYELCPYKDQAAQLAAYDLTNGRELSGIVIPCKPRLMAYRIGDALEIGADLDDATDLGGRVLVITGRHRDPATCTITFTFDSETDAKHPFALGQTGTAPPSPSLPTREDMDTAASVLTEPVLASLIANSWTEPTRILTAVEAGGTVTLTVADHDRVYPDGVRTTITGAVFAGLDPDTGYVPYYDDPTRVEAAPAIAVTDVVGDAQLGPAVGRHALGRIKTPESGSGDTFIGGGVYPTGATIGGEIS